MAKDGENLNGLPTTNLKHVGINFPRTRDLAVLTNKLQD